MKVSIGIDGATPIAPNYSILKAALVAAQAATPTGRVTRIESGAAIDPHTALHALFSENADPQSAAAALGHRFSSDAPGNEEVRDER